MHVGVRSMEIDVALVQYRLLIREFTKKNQAYEKRVNNPYCAITFVVFRMENVEKYTKLMLVIGRCTGLFNVTHNDKSVNA